MTSAPDPFVIRYPRLAELIGSDLRSLALLRVLVGLTLLGSLGAALADCTAYFSDAGVLPRASLIASDGAGRWSLHLANGQRGFIALLLLVQLVLAAMLTLGLRTRLASIGSFVLWISLVNRNPLLVDHGDMLLGALLFWMMFLPLNARYAIDAALASHPPPRDNLHVSWASLGLLLQIAGAYFFAAVLQSGPEWLPQFSAGYYLLMPESQSLPTARWLLGVPAILQALTLLAWLLLWLAPLLLFAPYGLRPLRLLGLVLLLLLNLGALLSLRAGLLPWLGMAGLTAFIGGWIWEARARRRGAPTALALYYDGDRPFGARLGRVMRELLVLPELQLAPAQSSPRARALLEANRSWVVIDRDEQAYLKWPALITLLHRSPLFAPLGALLRQSRLRAAGDALYDVLARRHGLADALGRWLLVERAVRWEIPRGAQGLAAAALGLVLAINLQSAQLLPAFTAPTLQALARITGLEQRWDRFAPAPRKEQGWWVAPARLADAREIDLLGATHAAPDYRPEAARHPPSRRWRNFETNLWRRDDARLYAAYADWQCRRWNEASRRNDERLLSFKLVYMLERTPPPGSAPAQLEQIVAARHACSAADSAAIQP